MNFFGHAVVAAWRDADRPFVLGAMLPDFAAMIRTRPPAATHAGIEAGMEFHHRTDEAFHGCAAFMDLSREAFGWLLARGVGRGSARAVAHVGVEMMLELPLARDAGAQRAYRGALDGAAEEELGRHVSWATGEERLRFERLRQTLLSRGAVTEDIAQEVIAERLARALSGRPLLALDAAAQVAVRDWVASARSGIFSRAPLLLVQLTARLP